ncbi:hypothetical protein MKW98_019860 [Papaver atlanticum]|uniref:Uncharacterized protein n=1 Tax=Papaver atlanticum TaxID=357466 RepID=A0AAD4S2D9_9MAGN|nr:hypothetical protein MKW98_019860 [Papaver atlanticum]
MSDSQQTAVNKYGFIVMTDEGVLFGTLSGMTKEILHQFSVELPKKRWPLGNKPPVDRATDRRAWIDYVKKIAGLATQFYIDQDTREPNITGLIVSGYEFLMESLTQDGMLDPALEAKILCCAVISYADDSGFNHAIDLSSDYIADVKFVQEKRLIRNFFAEALGCKRGDKWNCVFGVEETLKALESGAVKTLMVCENMDVSRYIAKKLEKDRSGFYHLSSNEESEVENNQFSIRCLATKYNSAVEFVTDKTPEGRQFCGTFKGIGGIFRHQLGEENGKGF